MSNSLKIEDWLPITKKEVEKRDWDQLDVILISGDAYVDHPSFGTAVIARVIEKEGYKVAIIPQPNWQDDLRDFKKLGKPRLFFGVNAGVMDSMVNHYTAHKRRRSNDAYTPGDRSGVRPDYAVTVYSKILKKLFPETPIVIGGVEASLRRLTHYDYWSDQLKPSTLVESGADVLVYGMGEIAIKEILQYFDKGDISLHDIKQIGYLSDIKPKSDNTEVFELNSHKACLERKTRFAENFKVIETESNKMHAQTLVQSVGDRYVVINPPYPTQSEQVADEVYSLPYTRLPHPKYNKKPPIPAFEMIKNSINMHRGCFGGCSFCTISAHQGKFISSRSEKSILDEVDKIASMPDFKGTISDIGGPSANMYKMQGKDLRICEFCDRPSCIFPSVCRNLETDHKPMTEVYKKAAKHPKVKNVFVGSGIRYDLFVGKSQEESKKNGYLEYADQVIRNNVSGRLKVAPEHTSEKVLKVMRKPSFDYFDKLKTIFDGLNKKDGTKRQLIPYFISSHPGCRIEEMADLAIKTKEHGLRLEQVQDFTPTPMTLATVMYYTGIDPYSMKKIYRADSIHAKKLQRKFFFWYKPENKNIIISSLRKIHKSNLINKIYQK